MYPTDNNLVTNVRRMIEPIDDWRLATEAELAAVLLYLVYGENVFSQLGRTWTGCSFSQREESCLLVARSRFEGVNEVCFTTGRTPMDCLRIFMKKWFADTCEWSKDRFR